MNNCFTPLCTLLVQIIYFCGLTIDILEKKVNFLFDIAVIVFVEYILIT